MSDPWEGTCGFHDAPEDEPLHSVRAELHPSEQDFWRYQQLVERHHVPEDLALAVSSYAYGSVMALIEQGCEPVLAVQIAG